MRLAWLTDVHLNHADATTRRRLLSSLAQNCDAVAISGDIAESWDLEGYLRVLDTVIEQPIYFVLGNHDFYRGSIAATREAVTSLALQSKNLVYLNQVDFVQLTPNTAIIGHDGWADGRLGDLAGSDVVLNDYLLINELQGCSRRGALDKIALRRALRMLGDEAAEHMRQALTQAVSRYPQVIALTHVPPFRAATWHEGRISDDHWLPHFSCKAVGDAMTAVMRANPHAELLVLCGHTHGSGEAQLLGNIRVLTGAARYGKPEIQRVFELV